MASKLRVDSILPVDGAPTSGGGGIIQVVSAAKTDAQTITTSGTTIYDVTGLSVNITPKFSTSKMFIMAMVNGYWASSTGNIILLRRNTSDSIFVGDASGSRGQGTAHPYVSNDAYQSTIPIMYMDSPATTSATTYKISVQEVDGGGNTIYINRPASTTDSLNRVRCPSSITVMEVSA